MENIIRPISKTEIINNNGINEINGITFDTKSYNYENEKIVKYFRKRLDDLNLKHVLLECNFEDMLINTYKMPYDLSYSEEYDTMYFTFYRNSYDILSKSKFLLLSAIFEDRLY